jgi:hypothetical protein
MTQPDRPCWLESMPVNSNRAISHVAIVALAIVGIVVFASVMEVALLASPRHSTPLTVSSTRRTSSTSRSSSSSSYSSTASSSSQKTLASACSYSSNSSSSKEILPFRIISFQYDPLIDAIFAVPSSGNSVVEINATTNQVVNASYYGGANVTSVLFNCALNELYVNNNGKTTVIDTLTRLITSNFASGPDGVLFATDNELYLLNGSQTWVNFTVVNASNFKIIQNIALENCFVACSFNGAYFDPLNAYAYIVLGGFSEDGNQYSGITVLDTNDNSVIGSLGGYPNTMASFNPVNGIMYFASPWFTYHYGVCSFGIVPGNNITIVNGTSDVDEFRVNMNNASVWSYNGGYGQNGTCYPPPNFSQSGINDTLGSLVYDENNGNIYVVNGTSGFNGPTNLTTISEISAKGVVTQVLNFGASIENLFLDPANGSLYVSLADNSTALIHVG